MLRKWCPAYSSEDGSVVAIDGKTLRGSYDKNHRRGAIHVISAFSAMGGVVPGQLKTAEKSNKITAISELINLLDIRDKIITIDSMGCQKILLRRLFLWMEIIYLQRRVSR